jgi:nitrogen PTS system EIIA component
MNEFSEILRPDSVDAGLACSNKKALFQQLASTLAQKTGVDAKDIHLALNEREKLGSTGFGGGVAIPHGKIEGLDHVLGYLARLSSPIDFQSVDGLPVDLVFLLLSPPDAGADHLKALAGVSRLFRDKDMVAKIRGARSKDAMFALIVGTETLAA